MIDLQTRPHSLIENWSELRGVLRASGPASLDAFREENFQRFESVGLPTIKDEEFKYVSFREIAESKFEAAYGATILRGEIESTALGKLAAITVAFVNGQYAPELSSTAILPEGAFVGSLEDAFEQGLPVEDRLGRVASLEGRLGTTNDERLVHLNSAYLSEGAYIFIPRGVALETPIQLLYVSRADHGAFAAFPRTLIVIEENAQAKIIETYVGLEGTYLKNAVTEVWLGASANLEHTLYQHETPSAFHLKTVAVHQEGASVYTSNTTNYGGKLVRNELNGFVDGEHGETRLNGANIGTGEQVVDNHPRIDHAKPNCNSFAVYKSILRDKATGVFNGKIFVYQDAQKTDAKQTNQGILLSPTATFDTKPQLEIFADDVKCTHGATVGQLRSD